MKTETNPKKNQGHEANTLLAVSGLPELYKIRNHFVTTLPTGEVTAWNMICWAKDFTRYMDEIIHEAEKAVCASGAAGTVAERGMQIKVPTAQEYIDFMKKQYNDETD